MKDGVGVKDLDCYRVKCVGNEYINYVRTYGGVLIVGKTNWSLRGSYGADA